MAENAERNLRLLQELISCAHNLFFWTFDSRMTCVYSTCPDEQALKMVFALDENQTTALRELQEENMPVAITSMLKFLWIADFERDSSGKLLYIHVIGPAFVEDVAPRSLEATLNRVGIPLTLKSDFLQLLEQIPVIPIIRFFEYGLMLHYCITGEKISISDIRYPNAKQHKNESNPAFADAHGSWAMEQKVLKLVEDGNLDIKRQTSRLASIGAVGNLGNGDSLRHFKNITIIFTALCTRAAIRGGLDPEIAYTLSDRYINGIEACGGLSEIAEVNAAMQEDYARRVHQIKLGTGISQEIQKCCDFIQINIERKVTAAELADCSGYSEAHLARKFKQELGTTIAEYTISQKIKYAEALLQSGNKTVQEVAEQLGFHSQSYFGQQFKKITGTTPGKYQSNHSR